LTRAFTISLFASCCILAGLSRSARLPDGPQPARELIIAHGEPSGRNIVRTDGASFFPLRIMRGTPAVAARSGNRRGYVLLDTGCGTSIFNSRYLSGNEKTFLLEEDGFFFPGGPEIRYPRRMVVDRMAWGPDLARDLPFICLDLSGLESRLGEPVLAVLGADILATRVFLIDYPGRRMTLWHDGAPAGHALKTALAGEPGEDHTVYEKAFTLEGDGKIVLPLILAGRQRCFVLDTGSACSLVSKTVLPAEACHALEELSGHNLVLTSLTGRLASKPFLFDQIILGDYMERYFFCGIPGPENYFSTLSARTKSDIQGVLGHSFFRDKRVGFDFPGRRLLFRAGGRASF
jgi:hypothetical protein